MSRLTAYAKFVEQALKYGFSLFGLPKTGQTVEYQSGDDGTYQKGYPRQGPRYTDNGDGTITDNASGLMWAKDGNGAGCFYGGTLTWAAAITYAEGLDFAGHTDWRLPNAKELGSILDFSRTSPAINPIFINTFISFQWSSTTYAGDSSKAFGALFGAGGITTTAKSGGYPLRCVRGGI